VSAALVTGGTAGIGAACVTRLRQDGWAVAFTGRDAQRGASVAAATGAVFLAADAANRVETDRSVAEAITAVGTIDLLVANAGILAHGPVTETPDEVFTALVETNLTAVFRYCRAVFEPMRDHGGGSIVVIASDTAIRGAHELAAYSVVKAGAAAVAELFAADGAPYGIRANALCPGATLPGMAGSDPRTWRPTPSGRYTTGDDIAAAVAWLASDQARQISGATIRIDAAAAATPQRFAGSP
jgi:NAD(P)-dependent dehydrogenase (short-subunit alcohol dehydrogenase family)